MRRTLATVVTLAALALAQAPAASAHSAGGLEPTNYVTLLKGMSPRIAGVTLRVIEGGNRLELTASGGVEAIVLGYQDEPYLRIGPHGVAQNLRSPATFLNADRQAVSAVPGSADAKSPPRWEVISDEPVARWHDHRVHWMGERDPPAVRRAPGRTHVVIPDWEVPVVVGDSRAVATGDLVWAPGPSPLPFWALALTLGGLTLWAGRRGHPLAILGAIAAVLVVVDLIHAIGTAAAPAGTGLGTAIADSLTSLTAVMVWAAGVLAAALLARGRGSGLYAAAFAGLFIAILGGVVDIDDLSRSQVPFEWGASVARALVVTSLGAGTGLAAAAAWRIRSGQAVPSRTE